MFIDSFKQHFETVSDPISVTFTGARHCSHGHSLPRPSARAMSKCLSIQEKACNFRLSRFLTVITWTIGDTYCALVCWALQALVRVRKPSF